MPTFDINDLGSMEAYLNEKTRQAAVRACFAAAERLINHIVTEIIPAEPRQPVDVGLYRASWKPTLITDGADVSNAMPYAPIIEYGARAENIKIGRKMLDALAAWAKRKGLAQDDQQARDVAWAIAVSFQKKGIYNEGKGLRILEKASKKIPEFYREEFARELKRM